MAGARVILPAQEPEVSVSYQDPCPSLWWSVKSCSHQPYGHALFLFFLFEKVLSSHYTQRGGGGGLELTAPEIENRMLH